MILLLRSFFFFFFNDTATTEIYTLSLHDALPISSFLQISTPVVTTFGQTFHGQCTRTSTLSNTSSGQGYYLIGGLGNDAQCRDRKSTRLNSSHGYISYAVFCLKKKNNHNCA